MMQARSAWPRIRRIKILRSRICIQYINNRQSSVSAQLQTQSIDEIFDISFSHHRHEQLPAIEHSKATKTHSNIKSIQSIIGRIQRSNGISKQNIYHILRHLKDNKQSLVVDAEMFLQAIKRQITSSTRSDYEATQIYGLIINMLQIFVTHSQPANTECITCMIDILCALDASNIEHSMHYFIYLLYSLLQYATIHCPVSFETYIKVMEFVSSPQSMQVLSVAEKDELITYILQLLLKTAHRDQAEIDQIASSYLMDYKPIDSKSEIATLPKSNTAKQQLKLIQLFKEKQARQEDILSIEQLSQLYHQKYNELLSVQAIIDYTLQQLRNIANEQTALTPSPSAINVAQTDIALPGIREYHQKQWEKAPNLVALFLSRLHDTLQNDNVFCPYHTLYDTSIDQVWRLKYNEKRQMSALKNWFMHEWDFNDQQIGDEYRLLLQLAMNDCVNFRVMSVLLYSWNTIKLAYNRRTRSWHYMLRPQSPEKHHVYLHDQMKQTAHQKNIIRWLLHDLPARTSPWSLRDIINGIEHYLDTESQWKFPENSHLHRHANDLFPSILHLFPLSEFSWHFPQFKGHRVWDIKIKFDGDALCKIQHIISCRQNKKLSYKELREIYGNLHGDEALSELPSEEMLINGYGHILRTEQAYTGSADGHRQTLFCLREGWQAGELDAFMDTAATNFANPVSRISQLLSFQQIPTPIEGKPVVSRYKQLLSRMRVKSEENVDVGVRFEYTDNVTASTLIDVYEAKHGMLPLSRIDTLLQNIGFSKNSSASHSLQFLPQNCVPSITCNPAENVKDLICIFPPFTMGNQMFNLLYQNSDDSANEDHTLSVREFYESFQDTYGYQLPLTHQQLYFYLYHQFYPFISLYPFDIETQNFYMTRDCKQTQVDQVRLLDVDELKRKYKREIKEILNAHPDGIEFHRFWKELQAKTSTIIFVDFGHQQREKMKRFQQRIPVNMFDEMKQFTLYSRQLMEFWKDQSPNPSWTAFVEKEHEQIQIYLKPPQIAQQIAKIAAPDLQSLTGVDRATHANMERLQSPRKRKQHLLSETLQMFRSTKQTQTEQQVTNFDEEIKEYEQLLENVHAVRVGGLSQRIHESVLKRHLIYHLAKYKSEHHQFKHSHDAIVIDAIFVDPRPNANYAFVYFADEFSKKLALDLHTLQLGEYTINITDKTIPQRQTTEKPLAETPKPTMSRRRLPANASPKVIAFESKELIKRYLAKHADIPPHELLGALYDNIGYIKQNMAFNEFRAFLINECHSFLRLEPPSRKSKVLGRWSVFTDICIPTDSEALLSETEQRMMRFNDKIVHTIAMNPYYGMRLHEVVTHFERETGKKYPETMHVREHLDNLVKLGMLNMQDTPLGNTNYLVPTTVRYGIFLKRILSFHPQGLPFTELTEKWIELEAEDRKKRNKKIFAKNDMKAPSFVKDVDNLLSVYYGYIRIRYDGNLNNVSPSDFDVNKVILYPKLDPDAITGVHELNRKGKIYGFNIMQFKDKLDFVLNKFSAEYGLNICELLDQYELMIGASIPYSQQTVFSLLSQYNVHYEIKDPRMLSRVYPNRFITRLRQLLESEREAGIYDDELPTLWQSMFDEEMNIENKRDESHRALVLYDKFYSILKVRVEGESKRIKYYLRERLMEDSAPGLDHQYQNFVRIVRDTLHEYRKEHQRVIAFIDFVDYFEETHKTAFPCTRSLRRALLDCSIGCTHSVEIDKIECFLNPL